MSFWQDFGALFTPTEKTKLAGIEDSATADQTNAEIRDAVEAATNSNAFTDTDHTKLNGVDTGAKDDQTGAEIKTAYEGEADTNAYDDAAVTKLAGIDAGADVTGSNPPQSHGASVHTDRTRTMFIGAHYYTTGGTDEVGVALDPDTDEKVAYRFQLPSDFSSLTSVQIAYSEAANDPAEHSWVLDVDVKIGVPPYVWNQHGGTDNGNVVAIGAYEDHYLDYFTIDSSCFTNIDANDICTVIINRDANNGSDTFIRDVMIQGIKITYTADM